MGFSTNSLSSALYTVTSAFQTAGNEMSQALERISTGSRINRASDDFTGFAKLADLSVDNRTYTDAGNSLREGGAVLDQVLDVANQIMDDLQNMETALNNGDAELAAGYGDSIAQALTLTDSQGNSLINSTLITDLGLTAADGSTALTNTITAVSATLSGIDNASVVADVTTAISDLETYISEVDGLKSTVSSQTKLADIMASNSEAVASAITEIDEAAEMAKYVDADIRQQAAISMVSQANISRRNISLLYR